MDTLCDAIEARGANALPVYCGSLRGADPGCTSCSAGPTHWSPRCSRPAARARRDASAGGDDEAWDIGALAELDVPVLQGLCLTSSRAAWDASDAALSPMDAAMQVAIPEFDGRLITVPFSFKEQGPDDVPVYVADPERAARVAGIAVRHARLKHKPNAEKKLALVFTAYPTKHSRVGNAVGLDTPGIGGAGAGRAARRRLRASTDYPDNGDELIHRLINAGGHDVEWLTEEQLAAAPARVPLADYQAWFDKLEPGLREGMLEHWGEPPGSPLRRRRRHRAGLPPVRERRRDDPAAARLRREPDRDLPRPGHAALAPLHGGLPLAGRTQFRRRRDRPHGQARHDGVAAGQGPRPVGGLRARTRCSANCRWSTRSSSTTPARAPRPSGAGTPPSWTIWCRRWRAPTPTATWPSWSSCSTSTRSSPTWTRRRPRPYGRRSGRW